MGRIFHWKYRKDQWNKLLNYKSTWGPKIVPISILSYVFIFTTLYGAYMFFNSDFFRGPKQISHLLHDEDSLPLHQRHLLSTAVYSTVYDAQCIASNQSGSVEAHVPEWETCTPEFNTGLSGLFIALYIIFTIITFIALAIVCDDFFVPSLEAISEKLELSEAVAGATFMAAGSSAPELFSSIAAVSFESDVGVGTITGSAVFNLLVIISLTAAFAGQVLKLDWRPLTRDSIFYAISIIWFIYSVWDTLFQVWEPVVMLVLYLFYILTMVFNKRLMDWMGKWCNAGVEPTDDDDLAENGAIGKQNGMLSTGADKTRRLSAVSQSSEQQLQEYRKFRHDRRNSAIHMIADAHPGRRGSVKSDEMGRRGSIKAHTAVGVFPIHSIRPLDGVNELYTHEDEDADTLNMQPLHEEDRESGLDSIPVTVLSTNDQPRRKVTIVKEAERSPTPSSIAPSKEEGDEEEDEEDPVIKCCCACCPPIRGSPPSKEALTSSLDEADTGCKRCCAYTIHGLKWVIFVLAFPFLVCFSYTIPDCSKDHNRKYFLLSFFTSVLWIAGLSFLMVTIVARMGCLIGIDSYVMSLVILAAGTSIPDLLSSIIVARDGFGDMAVSNAIGSNVFDINLGLGLPFLIRLIVKLGEPINFFSAVERIAYCEGSMLLMPHPKFGFILMALLLICMVGFGVARFKLNKGISISFFLLYLAFLVYAFSQEFLCNKTGLYNC